MSDSTSNDEDNSSTRTDGKATPAFAQHRSERPDPEANAEALQAGHDAARAALAPLLRECAVPHDDAKIPDGRHHDTAREIAAELEELHHTNGFSMFRVFEDFVEFCFQSLQASPDQKVWQETMDPYAFTDDGERRSDAPTEHFQVAHAKLLEGTAEGQLDILGDVYHILRVNHDDFGQYFTPHNVGKMMREIAFATGDTLSESSRETVQGGDISGCGSGQLILEQAQARPDGHFSGIDIDETCAKMAAVNCALVNVDAEIVHGNALSMDFYSVFLIRQTEQYGGVITVGDVDEYRAALEEAADSSSAEKSDSDGTDGDTEHTNNDGVTESDGQNRPSTLDEF